MMIAPRKAIYASDGFLGSFDSSGFNFSTTMAAAGAMDIGSSDIDTVLLPFIHPVAPAGGHFTFNFHNLPFGDIQSVLPYIAQLRNGVFGPPKKVLLSMGGAGGDADFVLATSDPAMFAADLAQLCLTYGFDGLDFDYEGHFVDPSWPNGGATALATLATQIKTAMPNCILVAAPAFTQDDAQWGQLLSKTAVTTPIAGNLFSWFGLQFYVGGNVDWQGQFQTWSSALPLATANVGPAFLQPGWSTFDPGTAFDLSLAVNSLANQPQMGGAFIWNYAAVKTSGIPLSQWSAGMSGNAA